MKFMTTAERIGRQEGESSLLLSLLEHKFKHVPEEYVSRIRKANEDILLAWGKRFVTAETLEDIFIA